MENIFSSTFTKNNDFSWENLGNIKEGRKELGENMPVLLYRMFAYSMNHILTRDGGQDYAVDIFRRAGYLAGAEFARNILNLSADPNAFIFSLQEALLQFQMGILRFEVFKLELGEFVLTLAEDLDCSGISPANELVCTFDEGFFTGIIEAYTGKKYQVREIDCWANGARVCRFHGMEIHAQTESIHTHSLME